MPFVLFVMDRGTPARLAIASALLLSAFVTSQGPVYRERWGYLHLESLRAQVLDALVGRSPEDVAEVSKRLAAPDEGLPFRPVASALAYLRGVESDGPFLMRAGLGLFVLPEVVDADSTLPTCRSANFTVCLPFMIPVPGAMKFEFVVRDQAGEKVWSKVVDEDVDLRDVRLSQIKASVPAELLPDGRYEVELLTSFGNSAPRPNDPVYRWTFHALRGYQARADKAMAVAITDRSDYAPLVRAQLDGLAQNVNRAFSGQAFAVQSDAVRELELLEHCLENLAKERPPLFGMTGAIPTAMPAGGAALMQPCLVRGPSDDQPHPMVVFASASPSYNQGSQRPTAPETRSAKWLWRELGDFGVAEKWHVACCDSPGGGRRYAEALEKTLEALPKVLPTGGQKPLLVCDREAASVVALQLARLRPHISGLVMCGFGSISRAEVGKLGGLPVRLLSLNGYPGSSTIERMMEYVDHLREAGGAVPDIARLHDRAEPWPFGVSRSRRELAAFAAEVFGER